MHKNPLPALITLLLLTTTASLTACSETNPTNSATEIKHQQVQNKTETVKPVEVIENATVDEQIQAWKDTGVLKPTNDPNVWKATKPLPRPTANLKYPKPEYPAKGYEHTQEGAEAVAIYLEHLLAYAYVSGDTADLEKYCSSESKFCSGIAQSIKTNETNEEWIADYHVNSVQIIGVGIPDGKESKGEVSFRVEYNSTAHFGFSKTASTVTRFSADQDVARINLSFVDNHWLVVAGSVEE
ncbi:hypothetical protein HMPREF0044_0443 [Gleimia coleocanis DSM 15436]|uniref:DUF6318 domain-containing protein n=1 Tax=Gleimia coleocanis DSM 15436 TaxID=525245 RepID=C0VZ53_9ACTO|nr:DUF6318 family protein [Gleimia coleocanis]EEH64706.1 hypothetical protein HMPREF0044_0443 [Gleimia coleocanis DSM 15436]